ncbi:hypothetical protein [Nocardiopsis ansamitocini]|uniref:Uncharacterized protein n=1 Tax=Nocardiopsis ansamitocini TaxID=1670832 RepID=A0A9W6UKT3_9ACTN|nr:hypothetical protein [Nocardiopsis ansamitocini]GLU49385.1 hypothetical protein Nans01_37360 [Nocardiopsis ansamitocini]
MSQDTHGADTVSAVPVPPGTGEAALAERTVRGVRARLDTLDALPTFEHVAVFEAVHRELSEVLTALDAARG